ncbi:homoprotocatechuate degradation operon regulator HpaR [Pannonibacter tanglangensis]|uniref:Homoprotocatechuate degradation operon regulator HpaR n=1 Tax=Pannonibacter tanglangensis TaxID=2750084 RepID=A0ABW9ZIH1_9HYPH|nr:homoprotocatechuate degradation operon regulator HpaR [Pannonibacter sp. XCT-34]
MTSDSPSPRSRPAVVPGTLRPVAAGTRIRLRDFSKSLPMSLLRARETVMRQFRPSLAHFGITEQQWRVLRALTSVRAIEVLELADATCLLAPSLSRILKGLEERDLVQRMADETDMRRVLISISPAGQTLIEQAGAHSEVIYAEITRRYGAKRLAVLQDMLRDLEDTLADAPLIIDSLGLDVGPRAPHAPTRRGRPRKGDEPLED